MPVGERKASGARRSAASAGGWTGESASPQLVRVGSMHAPSGQRLRMIQALAWILAEDGYHGTTVTMIVARARVSRRTFYEHFEDCDDCFLAAFDEALRRMTEIAAEAYERPGKWSERVRTALEGVLGFLEREPATASLVFVESLRAGPKVLARRARVLEMLRAVADEGRHEARPGSRPPRLSAETAVAGVVTVIQARLTERPTVRLMALVNPLMAGIVLPYLGPAAAAKEGARPTPKAPRLTLLKAPPARQTDAIGTLDMRVTYRTLRVLTVIAGRPGACNRDIAAAAGISDQGQISQLLARLQSLGLIENLGERPRTGPHEWHLTRRGKQLRHKIEAEASGDGR
jgi:AcrR family transcriptional regulator